MREVGTNGETSRRLFGMYEGRNHGNVTVKGEVPFVKEVKRRTGKGSKRTSETSLQW